MTLAAAANDACSVSYGLNNTGEGTTLGSVAAGVLGTGAGFALAFHSGSYVASSVPYPRFSEGTHAAYVDVRHTNDGSTTVDVGTAIAKEDFWTFTVAPAPGRTLTLTNLTFDVTQGHNAIKAGFWVFAGDPGFTAVAGQQLHTVGPMKFGTSTTWYVFSPRSATLSGALFEKRTTPLEFRVYVGDDNTSTNGDPRRNVLDNIVLRGFTATGGTVLMVY